MKSPRSSSSASARLKSSTCGPRSPTSSGRSSRPWSKTQCGRIESGLFLPHSGIRFPQNPCTTCPFLGLCLDQRDLVETGLMRKPGVDLGLFDELAY